MRKKREPLVLEKVARKSDTQLQTMFAELCDVAAPKRADAPRWSKRFVASGKANGRKVRV